MSGPTVRCDGCATLVPAPRSSQLDLSVHRQETQDEGTVDATLDLCDDCLRLLVRSVRLPIDCARNVLQAKLDERAG